AGGTPSSVKVRPRVGRSCLVTLARAKPQPRERRSMADTTLTWLGHSTFRLDTAGGKRIYVDPFLNGNPKCPESEVEPERVDVIAITHAHGDHLGDTVELAKKHGCTG